MKRRGERNTGPQTVHPALHLQHSQEPPSLRGPETVRVSGGRPLPALSGLQLGVILVILLTWQVFLIITHVPLVRLLAWIIIAGDMEVCPHSWPSSSSSYPLLLPLCRCSPREVPPCTPPLPGGGPGSSLPSWLLLSHWTNCWPGAILNLFLMFDNLCPGPSGNIRTLMKTLTWRTLWLPQCQS